MIFKEISPLPPLDQIVQCYRLRHFIIPQNIIINPKPYTAKPEQCITFYARGFEITEVRDQKIKKPRSVMSGQYTCRINRFSGTSELMMILVVFKPGVLHKLTGIPFNELVDQHVDLEDVFPKEASRVNERLSACSDYGEMISIIERFLHSLLSKQKILTVPTDEIFNIIKSGKQNYPISWLASQSCLSTRQFERKSYQYLGISPMLFARIVRFDESYKMRLMSPIENWFSIAVECGYHDYQHLVRDYKQFADTSPNQLINAESKALDRVLGLSRKLD
jgi:AraC-like DNA-binding protein